MKRFFILLIFTINLLYASELTYEKAVQKGIKQNKPIMLVLVSNYCSWCNRFKKNILKDKDIKFRLDEEVITLIVNKSEDGYPKKFETSLVPTTFFIDPKNEEEIISQVGYANIENFKELLDDLKDMY